LWEISDAPSTTTVRSAAHRIGSQELGDDLRILIEAGWTKSDIRFMELLGMLPKSAIPLILEAHKGGETHRAALGARA
jgi:hypothetical protein